MRLRAVLFDANGTLIDIETDEGLDAIYRAMSGLLTYQGIALTPETLRDLYFGGVKQQLAASQEPHPEFDAKELWRDVLRRYETPVTRALPAGKREELPRFLAELHRSMSRKRLEAYADVRGVLETLRGQHLLGVVSDAQSIYARAELHATGLLDYFSAIVVSSDYGYRKPDPRLFLQALTALGVRPDEAVYVGNDMYCDVYGAQRAGMRAIFRPTRFGKKQYADTRADYTIENFRELPDALARLETR